MTSTPEDWLAGKTLVTETIYSRPVHTLSFFRLGDEPFYLVHGFQWLCTELAMLLVHKT